MNYLENIPDGILETLKALSVERGGLTVVDRRIAEVIQRLEPDIHQFWPIEIVSVDGSPYPVEFTAMRIGCFMRSFSAENSDPDALILGRFPKLEYELGTRGKGVVFRRSVFGDSHMWREEGAIVHGFFISNELRYEIADVIRSNKLLAPEWYELGEI